MTASEIQSRYSISATDAEHAEDWMLRQFEIIALHHPAWWARDCAQIKANVIHSMAGMITEVWAFPKVVVA